MSDAIKSDPDLEFFCYSEEFTDFPKNKCPVLRELMVDCFDCPRYAMCKRGYEAAVNGKKT